MEDERLEKLKAELEEKLGLDTTESLKGTLFQGDFGTSINLSILIPTVIIFLIGAFLFVYLKRKRKQF